MDQYAGNSNFPHAKASEARDVEARLKALDKGIGDIPVNIFSRETRGAWEKANPLPSGEVSFHPLFVAVWGAGNYGTDRATQRPHRPHFPLTRADAYDL